jgi:hypothetical protein
MTRGVCFWSVVILIAVVLIGRLSAATPIPPTPEEPPQFAVLKAAEKQTLSFIYWRPAIEQAASGPPVLVNQPREVTVEQSKVVGRTVSGKTLADEKAWQSAVGSAMILVPYNSTIDDLYAKTLNPETVLVQPRDVLPKEAPVPYPDGTLPADAPAGNTTPGGNAGAPTPQEVASAQQAIAPEVTRLKLKVAPAPIMNPLINQALPGFIFFPVPSDSDDDNKGRNRAVRIIIKKPDGSVETIDRDDDDEKNGGRIFDILREQMTVLTVADAKKYARVHLLIAEARHPRITFGPINNISVTSTANGGLSVYAEAPITGGATGPKSTAFTLTANFGKNGSVLGGVRSRS